MADENNNGADFVPTALEVQHGRGLARGMDIVDGDVARVVAGANDPHTVGGKAALSLRTTLARLTADLAAVTAERDMWRGECASISAELDLPPGMRPMEGELRRMLGHNRALLAERDEARGLLGEAHHVLDQMHDAEDTLGALKVDVPDDGYPRQRLFGYVTQYGHGLRARIAAHLGRSE